MRTMVTRGLRIATVAAGVAFAGIASADPIAVQFNIAALGGFTCNNVSVSAATACDTGPPNVVAAIQQNNVGLVSGVTSVTFSPGLLPLVLGGTFEKIFTTAAGTFTELLTVTLVQPGINSMHMEAAGTISCSGGPCLSIPGGATLDPTAVFFSVSYTQNGGPGQQINASFNNSTTPFRAPEPGTLALLGLGLAVVGFARRRKA